jgi:hypothetical protein
MILWGLAFDFGQHQDKRLPDHVLASPSPTNISPSKRRLRTGLDKQLFICSQLINKFRIGGQYGGRWKVAV